MHSRTTTVQCVDNGKEVEADIMAFKEGSHISVVMNTVRITLQYNKARDHYVGSMGGLEFLTKGPKVTGYY